nr:MAG TPA: hypothetical protein [Bacteriophage sp.]
MRPTVLFGVKETLSKPTIILPSVGDLNSL